MNKVLTLVIAFFLLTSAHAESFKKKKKKAPQSTKVSQADKVKSEKLFIRGMSYFIVGEYARAIDKFKAANQLDPNQAGIQFKLGDAYFKEGVKSQAIFHLKRAIEIDSKNKAYYFLLADVYKSEFQFKLAAETYQEMIKNAPGTKEFHLDLAKIYMYLGVNDKLATSKEKVSYLNKALENYNEAEKLLGIIDEIISDKQQIYLRLNKVEGAIAEGEKLINKYPNEISYRVNLAELKYRNGKQEEAIQDLEDAVEQSPAKSAFARIHLFEYYASQDNQEKAFEHLEKAFDLDDLNLDFKVKLIEQYYYQRMRNSVYKEQALILADKLSKKHSDKAVAHAVNGDVLYLSDNKEKARDAYINSLGIDNSKYIVWEQVVRLETDLQEADSVVKHADDALELFPNQPNLWLYKGIGHMLQKDDQNAVLAFEKGKKMTLGNRELEGFFNAQLGDSYNNLKEYEKADKAYEEALSVNPDNVHVLNNYSYYLSLRKDKLKKALVMSERLIQLVPNESTYLDTYGWVLYVSEDYGKAEEFLKKAVTESDNGTILEHYGDVLFKLGKQDEALNYWKKAKEAGDTTDLIDKKISDEQLYEE